MRLPDHANHTIEKGGEIMPLPHERHERPPHEELIELIERKFRELNNRLDDIEARLDK